MHTTEEPGRVPETDRVQSVLVSGVGSPFFVGNSIDILKNGVEIFPALLRAIAAAERSIEFLTFVYWSGDIADQVGNALADAARRGVAVRVLLDGIGAMPMDRELMEKMREAGADVRWFRPLKRWEAVLKASHRTHRKVLVCDHRVGFTGGVGIGEEWQGDARRPGEWRETHFRITGPAVQGLYAAFEENWLEMAQPDVALPPSEPPAATGTIPIQVVRSSAAVAWSDQATLLQTLIRLANESIRISTPYFSPDQGSSELLADVARRGVKVDILVPGPHIDHRVSRVAAQAYYEDLLDAGVVIREYQPTMIHQKITSIDSLMVSIGSANFNHRSLLQDDEVQLVAVDREFAERIDAMLDDDFAKGALVEPGHWKRRGPIQRIAEAATHLVRKQI